MAEIRINYDLTIRKARQIKELSDDLRDVSLKLTDLKEDSEGYWRGEAADEYRYKCEELTNYIRDLERKLEALGNAIIRIANIIREAEESVEQSASSLSDGG